MPGARRAKKGQTEKRKNSEVPLGKMWDHPSLQEFDGRANTNAGDKGSQPDGRWTKPYYETPAKIVGTTIVRDP